MKLWVCFFLLFLWTNTSGQILIDEVFDDWTQDKLRITDPNGDVQSGKIDFGNLWISNDPEYLFVSYETSVEVYPQVNNSMTVKIDFDNNISTGQIENGMGLDLIYDFGARDGVMFIDDEFFFINQDDIGILSLPSVSSDRFEFAIRRTGSIFGNDYQFNDQIRLYLEDDTNNGDKVPDELQGYLYQFDNSLEQAQANFSYAKTREEYIRIVSYNSLFDGLFEPGQRDAQRRIIQAIQPDIIGFQEIYSFDATQVANVMEDLIPSQGNQQWYGSRVSPDIILVSRFPIIGLSPIDGNGAFRVDIGDKQMLIIVAHLPCCDNDFERQQEADKIISYIRRAKDGELGFDLEEGSPIVIMGDMNLVGDKRQQETLVDGDIFNENAFGPDLIPDWDGNSFEDPKFYNTGSPSAFTWIESFSSFMPGRLDYIIYSGSVMDLKNSYGLYTPTMSTEDLNALGLNRFDTDNSSDHLPLVADFDVGLVSSTHPYLDDKLSVRLYPNPVSDLLKIEFQYNSAKAQKADIRDLNGRIVNAFDLRNGTHYISLSELEAGYYILAVKTAEGFISFPFAKI